MKIKVRAYNQFKGWFAENLLCGNLDDPDRCGAEEFKITQEPTASHNTGNLNELHHLKCSKGHTFYISDELFAK